MLTIKPDALIDYPEHRCPECGGPLYIEVDEWDAETGEVTEGGCHVQCEADDMEECDTSDGKWYHRYWQGDWMDIEVAAHRWLQENVRVRVA